MSNLDPDPKYAVINNVTAIASQTISSENLLLSVLILIVLLATLALISASEVNLLTFGHRENKDNEEHENIQSEQMVKMLQRPTHLLSTIIIVNTVFTIATILVASYILHHIISEEWYHHVSAEISQLIGLSAENVNSLSFGIKLLVVTVLISLVIVIFGESIPKLYASQIHRKLIAPAVSLLQFFDFLLQPINTMFVRIADMMETRNAANTNNSKGQQQSRKDIDAAIDLTLIMDNETSVQEAGILKGIVKFSDQTARQIMQPRLDIVAINEDVTFKELLKTIKEFSYSRVPVYREDLDNVIGIIYVKDLLAFHNADDKFDWQKLIRNTVVFAPESKKIDEMLREFQHKRAHMAIIVDEYGGTAGLVTLEDIMEEIVGEIRDEFDQEEETDYIKIAENHFIFDGKSLIKDVCRIIKTELSYFDDVRGEADSLGGMVLEITGAIPSIDRELIIGDVTLKVITVTKKRIEKISLIKNVN